MGKKEAPHPHHRPYSFCPHCAGPLGNRLVKPGEPERLVCGQCGFVYYLDPKVAACTVTVYEDRIVLVKRAIAPAYGKWVIPGGFVDRGETVEEAAIRETREETELEVRLTGLLNIYSYPGSIVVVVAYTAAPIGGVPRAADEALDIGLFRPGEIPWEDLAFPSTRDALRDFIKSLSY
jgi:ADP-ribose pyrophosphatase YjhB (NUDIX family)